MSMDAASWQVRHDGPRRGRRPAAYSHLFSPIRVGTMDLRNRAMLPPHASAIGNIYGSDEDARRNIAYFESRCANDGPAWVASLSTHLRNTLIPGFEPTGVGAATTGLLPAAVLRRARAGVQRRPARARHPRDRADGPPGRHAARRLAGDERADHQPDAARHGPGRHRRVRPRVRRVRPAVDGGPRRRRRAAPQPRRPARVVPVAVHEPPRGRLRRLAGEPRAASPSSACRPSATSSGRR